MSTLSLTAASSPPRFGLVPRLGVITAVSVVETLFMSYLIQAAPVDSLTGFALGVHDIQHWLFRFMIAYAVSLAILVYLRGATITTVPAAGMDAPIRMTWCIVHALLLIPFAILSAALYRGAPEMPFLVLAIAWHACGIAAAAALFAALAPLPVWRTALRQTRGLPLYALAPAVAAVIAIKGSQLLWAPASNLTFRLVQMMLQPFCASLRSDAATLTVATDHFAVTISEICSGLEGVGLMLVFCAAWLWHFRREYYFPRALAVIPAALSLVFLLNAVRIAALVLIGDAGYERIATVGFHSQAGWIAFNAAAFGVAIAARSSPWINRNARQRRARGPVAAENAAAAYLMPLLGILAAGMIAHALSAGFDLLYPLRLACAAGLLWAYRRTYASLDWTFGWSAPAVGLLVFGLWVAFAHFSTTASPMPEGLSQLTPSGRAAWIGCRALAAVVTVPIAEELAYRGFLLRRLCSARFETVALRDVHSTAAGWVALAISSIAFGVTHGGLWAVGILAGFAYGLLAIKSGKIGAAVVAHATTNGLLAVYVLAFGQWQLW